MTFTLYLNLAWQTAILTIIAYVAWWAFQKIKFSRDTSNTTAAIAYALVFLVLLIPPAFVFASGFVSAIRDIFLAL